MSEPTSSGLGEAGARHRRMPATSGVLTAYLINQAGNWLGYVALTVAVFMHTRSAIGVAAILVSARLLPALLTPLVVTRLETMRGRLLSRLYTGQALLAALAALVLWHFVLPALFVLVALDGIAALVASALLRATLARQAGAAAEAAGQDPDLGRRRANATLNLAFTISVAAFPALGGVAVALLGAPTAMVLNAASFVAGAVILRRYANVVPEQEIASPLRRLGDAWRYLRQARGLASLLAAEAGALVFFASVEPVEVVLARTRLHAGTSGYGTLLAVWGVGMVAGGVLLRRLAARRSAPLLAAGSLGVGAGMIVMGAAPSLAVACGGAVVGGLGNGVQWGSLLASVQRLADGPYMARLMGAVESIGAFCPAIGALAGGVLASLTGPRGAFIVAGCGACASTGIFVLLAREIDRPRQAVAPGEPAASTSGA